MNGQFKKIISTILIVSLVIANNGFSVLAESVEAMVHESLHEKEETINYYYEEYYEEQTYIEEFETEFELTNDNLDESLIEDEESITQEESSNEEESFFDEIVEDEETNYETDYETEPEEDLIETESEESVQEETNIETEKENIDSPSNDKIEDNIEEETETTNETNKNEETETSTNSNLDENEETIQEETEEEKDIIIETTQSETEEIETVGTESTVEKTEETEIEFEDATISETVKEETNASQSEIEKEVNNEEATKSEIEKSTLSNTNITTESEIKKSTESQTSTKSEIISSDSNVNATNSETKKEIFVATVSKTSWKVKKVLVATYSIAHISATETEATRKNKLATNANVIIVNDKGEEKIVNVKLKWNLIKTVDVNAKTGRDEKVITVNEWRDKHKIDEFINEKENEVIKATSNIAEIEERIKEEIQEKEIVIKTKNEKGQIEELNIENKEIDETTLSEIEEESIEFETSEIINLDSIFIEETINEEKETELEINIEIEEDAENNEETTNEILTKEATEESEESEESIEKEEISSTEKTEESEETVENFTGTEEESLENMTENETLIDDIANEIEENNENTETNSDYENEEEIENIENKEEETTNETIVEENKNNEVVEDFNETEEESVSETLEDSILETEENENNETSEQNFIEETSEEIEIKETEEETVKEVEDIENENIISSASIATKSNSKEIISGLTEESIIQERVLNYYDLQSIYLYEVDTKSLGDEIIGAIKNINEEETKIEETNTEKKNDTGILSGIMRLFGVAKEEETSNEEETLEEYLKNANVEVVEESIISPILVEQNTLNLIAGASHDVHSLSEMLMKNGKNLYDKVNSENMGVDILIQKPLDVIQYSNLDPGNDKHNDRTKKMTGGYFLPQDIVISNPWIVPANSVLAICTNGHDIKFATAGCIKGQGQVIICNCDTSRTSVFTTGEPHYNWKDQFYASTSETYTKYNEMPFFSGSQVKIFGLRNSKDESNILFKDSYIKNQYMAQVALHKMQDHLRELDDPEISGGGSLVHAKKEMIVLGVDFKNNKAMRTNGVAINCQLGSSIVENCLFENNTNTSNRGGAIAINSNDAIIYDCIFRENHAKTNGGAIYGRAYKNGTVNENGAIFENLEFLNNKAMISGGAIFLDNLANVTIKSSGEGVTYFMDNIAGKKGGAISIEHYNASGYNESVGEKKEVLIDKVYMENNMASEISMDNDGQVDVKEQTVTESKGGGIYIDGVAKKVSIKNSIIKNNIAKGIKLKIDSNSTYYLRNYGGGIYAKDVELDIYKSDIDGNQSITGANICINNATLTVSSGSIINGKPYNDTNKTSYDKRIVSPGGGAIYLMSNATAILKDNVKISNNANALYLDNANIEVGNTIFEENTGEYLFGHTNYNYGDNKILFNGVNIKDHHLLGYGKNYSIPTTWTEGTKSETDEHKGILHISFKGENTIENNKITYTKDNKEITEECNIMVRGTDSNVRLDLKEHEFSYGEDGKIGLYYEFEDSEEYHNKTVFDKWDEENVKIYNNTLWSEVFSLDNTDDGQEKSGWAFYRKDNEIKLSNKTFKLEILSYVDGGLKFAHEYYDMSNTEDGYVKINTPSEIKRSKNLLKDKTLVGFLGKTNEKILSTESYITWDFDKYKVKPKEYGDTINLVAIYTDDTIKIKACGCPNGENCNHKDENINHKDRGIANSHEASASYLNYIAVASPVELAYRYEGKKTQYVLNKDITLSAEEAKEYLSGQTILNLNGKTLKYNASKENDYILGDGKDSKPFIEELDGNVFLVGKATESSPKGKITSDKHNGMFIKNNAKGIYIKDVEFSNIKSVNANDKGLINYDTEKGDSFVYIENTDFENIEINNSLVGGSSKVLLKNVKTKTSIKVGNNPLIKLNSTNENSNNELIIEDSEIGKIDGAKYLFDVDDSVVGKSTNIMIKNSSIINNKFIENMIDLDKNKLGNDSKLEFEDKNEIKGNEIINGSYLISSNITNNFIGSQSEINIYENIVPDAENNAIIYLKDGSNTEFNGKVNITDNLVRNNGTSEISAVRQDTNSNVYIGDTAIRVTENKTKYNWYVENEKDKEVFKKVVNKKVIASRSKIEIRLKNSNVEQVIYRGWDENSSDCSASSDFVFTKDNSYGDNEEINSYKSGIKENTIIYFGKNYIVGKLLLMNYKEGVDERAENLYDKTYEKLSTQRIAKNVLTRLDKPIINLQEKEVVMWEGLYYPENEDASEEKIYPQDIKDIEVSTDKDFIISGYRYRKNVGKRHVHGDNIELWIEARNEGHLQATKSLAYLHNDMTITRSRVIEDDFTLCLNGYTLTIDNNVTWLKANKDVNIKICDCTKEGSISQKGVLENNLIEVENGTIKLENLNIDTFENISKSFLVAGENATVILDNLSINNVNANYSTQSDAMSFIDLKTTKKVEYKKVVYKNNKLNTSNANQNLIAIKGDSTSDIYINELVAEANEVKGEGSLIEFTEFKNYGFDKPIIKNNKVMSGTTLKIRGSNADVSTVSIVNADIQGNSKEYIDTINDYGKNSSIFEFSNIKDLTIVGGSINNNIFNANGNTTFNGNLSTVLYLDGFDFNAKNVKFNGNNNSKELNTNAFIIDGAKNVIFDNCLFENTESANSDYIKQLATNTGKLEFRNNTKFTNINAKSVLDLNANDGKVEIANTNFSDIKATQVINIASDVKLFASGSIIEKITGVGVRVNGDKSTFINSEIKVSSGDAGIDIGKNHTLTLGGKMIVKGNVVNLKMAEGSKILGDKNYTLKDGSEIYLTVPDTEFNFYDTWSKDYIENYGYHNTDKENPKWFYYPEEIFKLDEGIKNRKVYKHSTNVKLYVGKASDIAYATLVYYDNEVKKTGKISEQYVAAGEGVKAKADVIHVNYLSTSSQVWMAEITEGSTEKTEWKVTEDHIVENLVAGKTYNVYLVKKHIHKECGYDLSIPCDTHANGENHTEEYEFIEISSDEMFRDGSIKSNYFGLVKDITMSQESIDYLASLDDVKICLGGHNLYLEKGAKFNTSKNISIINCEKTGVIKEANSEADNNTIRGSLISSSAGNLSLYNLTIEDYYINEPLVVSNGGTIIVEATTFSNIITESERGIFDVKNAKPYINKLTIHNSVAENSVPMLSMDGSNYSSGKIGTISIVDSEFTKRILEVKGTTTLDIGGLNIKNNILSKKSEAETDCGTLVVENSSSLRIRDYANIINNDLSINKNTKGGGITIFGTLTVGKEILVENNKANKGAGIYISESGKFAVGKKAVIKGNEGESGAGIYAEKLLDTSLDIEEIVFDGNKAENQGVVSWQGNLNLRNVTFRNHFSGCSELIYNRGEGRTDKVVMENILVEDNVTEKDGFALNEVMSGSKIKGISIEGKNNYFNNFITINKGAVEIDGIGYINNKQKEAVIKIKDTSNVTLSNAELSFNRTNLGALHIENGILNVKDKIYIEKNQSINQNGIGKDINIPMEGVYLKGVGKLATDSKMAFSTYQDGVKVFEGWNVNNIENFGKPLKEGEVGKYIYSPDNSLEFTLNDEAKKNKYSYYKSGQNGEVYLGSSDKYVELKFISSPDDDKTEYGIQRIAKNTMTTVDIVNTFDGELDRQTWVAPKADGGTEIWKFNNTISANYGESVEITYLRPHVHKICGCPLSTECNHKNGAIHSADYDFSGISNQDELQNTTVPYVSLKEDLILEGAMTIPSTLKGICLNGYTIYADGSNANSIFNLTSGTLEICNCKKKGGLSSKNANQSANLLNVSGGTLNLYGIDIGTMSITKPALNVSQGKAYLENVNFRNMNIGQEGLISCAGNISASKVIVEDNNSKISGSTNDSILLTLNSKMDIDDLVINNNTTGKAPIVSFTGNVSLDNMYVSNNISNHTDSETAGIIHIGKDAKVIVENEALINNNESKYDGGALFIEGQFESKNNLIITNNIAKENGAGLLIKGETALLKGSTASIIANNSKYGSGAKLINVSGNVLDVENLTFDGNISNKSSSDNNTGIIDFTGNFVSKGILFKNHKEGKVALIYGGEESILDISETYFENNTSLGDAIHLENSKEGTKIHNIITKNSNGNIFTNLINIENGFAVVQNVEIENNEFENAILNVRNTSNVSISSISFINNTNKKAAISLEQSKIGISGKVIVKDNKNTNVLCNDENSYLVGNGILSKDSEIHIGFRGLTNAKVFEGWNENNIEKYNKPDKKADPIEYMYTPENSGLFKLEGEQKNYVLYKKGTESITVHATDKNNVVKLTFIGEPEDEPVVNYGTQYIDKNTITTIDLVDAHEYELEKQDWLAPKGESEEIWKFTNKINALYDNSATIKLVQKHLHRVCGTPYKDDCEHTNDITHDSCEEYFNVSTVSDATNSSISLEHTTNAYVALSEDIIVEENIILSEHIKGICLNGHKIIVHGKENTDVITVEDRTIDICDCKYEKEEHGEITYEIKEEIIPSSAFVNTNSASAKVNLYRVHFSNINTIAPLIKSNKGNIYIDNVKFTNINQLGENGIITANGDTGTVEIGTIDISENNLIEPKPVFIITNGMTVSTISVLNNTMYSDIVKINNDIEIKSFTVKDNNAISSNEGIIKIEEGKEVTITEVNELENNYIGSGGVFKIAGSLILNKKNEFVNNTASKNGGAIYITESGKFEGKEQVIFKNNKANYGAAIYAEKLEEDSLILIEPIFDENESKIHGVIVWGGELTLSSASFINHTANSHSLLYNLNKDEGKDKLNLTNPIFNNNKTNSSNLILNDLAKDSIVSGVINTSNENEYNNFFEINKGNLLIENVQLDNGTYKESVIKITDGEEIVLSSVSIANNNVTDNAVEVNNTILSLEGKIIIDKSINGNKQPDNIRLNDGSYLKAINEIDNDSKFAISTNKDNVKVFEGWGKKFFENYNNPDSEKQIHTYSPIESGIFILDESAKKENYQIYKKGLNNVDLYLGSGYVTLAYVNESVEPNITYANQYIAKGVETDIEIVNSHEYELDKQIWIAPNEKTNNTMQWRFTDEIKAKYSNDQTIKYLQMHIHKPCGHSYLTKCNHQDEVEFDYTGEYKDVNSQEKIENTKDEYLSLTKDIYIEGKLNLPAQVKSICLNGHDIISIGGDNVVIDLESGRSLTICDCKNEGAISVEDGMSLNAPFINSKGNLGLYNMKFKNMFMKASVINIEAGKGYIENPIFTGFIGTGENGVVTNSGEKLIVASPTFENNNLTTKTPLIKLTEKITISTLSIINNKSEGGLIELAGNIETGTFKVYDNESNGNGTILIAKGSKLTLTEEMEFKNNISKNGGVFYIEGELIANKEMKFTQNEALNKGGAIYIAEGGKFNSKGKISFNGNIAKNGSSIYAEKLNTEDLILNTPTFEEEKPLESGIIDWGGELKLASVSVLNGLKGGASIFENLKTDGTDKLILENIRISNNKMSKNAFTLTNLADGSIIKNITVDSSNTFDNVMKIKGGKLILTNTTVTANTFTNAGIHISEKADVLINNLLMNGNSSNVYGALYIGGEETKVETIGNLELTNNATAGIYGAALTIDGINEFNNMSNSTTITNNRGMAGGAVYLNGILGVGAKTIIADNKAVSSSVKAINIYVSNENSYVVATDKLDSSSKLGFTVAKDNSKVFEYWNSYNIENYENPTTENTYSPENSGIFILDDASKDKKHEFYKSGYGEETSIKLGSEFVKLTFMSSDKKTTYATQNIEKNVKTHIDSVIINKENNSDEKWVAPSEKSSSDERWIFGFDEITATYSKNQTIYKFFYYTLKYTAGTREGYASGTPIPEAIYEYGEPVIIANNPYTAPESEFKHWRLREAVQGIPSSYKEGEIGKNLTAKDGGVAYLEAAWEGECLVRYNPNGLTIEEEIEYNADYDAIVDTGSKVVIKKSYPDIKNKGYTYTKYNTKPDGSGKTYKIGDVIDRITEDLELFIMWEEGYTIQFYPNFGSYKLDPKYTIYVPKGQEIRIEETYPKSLSGGFANYNRYNTKPDGSGETYYIGRKYKINKSMDLYARWYITNSSGGGGGGSSGGGGGGSSGGGRISLDDYKPSEDTYNPNISSEKIRDRFYADHLGNIFSPNGIIVGNIHLGDRVTLDGNFIDVNGNTHLPNGTIIDPNGTAYKIDGSITFSNGMTFLPDGTIVDKEGIKYKPDGSIIYLDGSYRDVHGIIHHLDGSLTTTEGVRYFIDGSILYPDGTLIEADGTIRKRNMDPEETPGSWEYDTKTNKWKFFDIDMFTKKKVYYENQWIKTKNSFGELVWYLVGNGGEMQVGWVKAEGDLYFLSSEESSKGELVTGTVMIDDAIYNLDKDTGALLDNKKPAYFEVLGAKNNRVGIDGDWVLSIDTGSRMFMKKIHKQDGTITEEMAIGWTVIDGYYYYFDDKGVALKGLVVIDDKYYFMNEDGTMMEGGQKTIDGIKYDFDKATGACRHAQVVEI